MKIIKSILITFLFFCNFAIANDKLAKEIINLSKESLYNLDHEQLSRILQPYLNKNNDIQALIIKDKIDDSIFLSAEYKNEKYIFSKSSIIIPKELNRYQFNIIYEGETLGSLSLYVKDSNKQINFTKEEKSWIKNNVVKVGVEPWAPVIFSHNGSDFNGITGDILKLMVEKSGLQVQIVTDFWDPLLEAFKKKEIDLLPATYYTEERATYGLYSKPYYKMLDYIYVKDDNTNIYSLKDLNGKKLAIPKGFGTIPKIKKKFPLINIVETQDLSDSIIHVLSGKTDALYEGQIAVEYKIQEELLTGLKGIAQNDFKASALHFFSRDDEPLLQSILEKSLTSIPPDQINKIKSKWLISRSQKREKKKTELTLTSQEKRFLEEHPILKVSSETDYPPFDFTTNSKPDGYSIDFINLLASKIGFEVEYVTDSWGNLLTKIKNNEIDIIHTLKKTKEREAFLDFTSEIIRTNEGIFTRNTTKEIKSYKDFNNKTIGLTKGEAITSLIQKDKNKDFEIILFDNYEKLIQSLSYGDVDAIIIDVNVGNYLIKKNDLYNINVVGEVNNLEGSSKDRSFRIAVRDDYPILKDILNKGIKSLSNNEIQQLKQKWFGAIKQKNKKILEEKDKVTSLFLISAISIFLVIAFISLLFIKFLSDELIAKYFGSKYFKIVVLAGMSITVLLIIVLSFHTLEKNKKEILLSVQDDLHFVLNTTTSRLDAWINDRTKYLVQLGRDPQLVRLAQEINRSDQSKQVLINSNAQKEIRKFFEKRKNEFGDLGFFIIDKNYLSLASKRDTNIGSKNVIAKYKPELLNKVFQGKSAFIPPIPSDIELTTNKILEKNNRKQMTMFFAVPIQDEKGNVISILTQRLEVEGELSNIIQSGYIGSSGESYIFNKDGFMLSKSRFREELYKIGLLKAGEKEYEKLVIRDPGINLLKNQKHNIDITKQPLTFMAKDAINLSKGLINKHSEINSNIIGYRDYRGVQVYGAWVWSKELDFGLTSEIDEKEALKGFYILRQNLLVITGLTLLLTIISTVLLIILGEKATRSVQKANSKLNKLLESFDENVIASKTDIKGIITYASKEFCKISGYTNEELVGSPQNIVRHPDSPKILFKGLWETIQSGNIWRGEVKNKKKDGGFYWVDVVISPEFNEEGIIIGYSAIRHDITSKKAVEELSLNLEHKVEERTAELKEQQERFELTIAGSGDGLWEYDLIKKQTWYSPLFKEMLGFTEAEFENSMDAWQSRVHNEDLSFALESFRNHLKNNTLFDITYRIRKKDDTYIWVRSRAKSLRDVNGRVTRTSGSVTDITLQKNNELEIENAKKQTESILTSIMLPMLITSKDRRDIVYANTFAENQYETTAEEILGLNIDILYTYEDQKNDILREMETKGKIKNFETKFKTLKGNEFDALLSLVAINYNGEECYLGVASDISEQKNRELLVKTLHKNTSDSIEYASLIQHALIPEENLFHKYFKDYFTIWQPKDVVGGDIYLFEELRDKGECLLMVIDCTGHGVPGAFVTMLVKAIERQVIADILSSNEEVSPSKILQYFNVTMKKLLKQESKDSISNAGFDGGILYYNKKENYVKYAGSETPLFYIQNEELNIFKSNRHSIGYKKSDVNYEFDEHRIDIDTETKIYISTDGYLDQNGGDKGFPFGKKRFQELISKNDDLSFSDQKNILLDTMQNYMGEEERNDDTTVVGLKFVP